MARPQKRGLEYFPVDINMNTDPKVYILEAKHGITGFGVLIRIFMYVYRSGYYCSWSDKDSLVLSKQSSIPFNIIEDIIRDSIEEDIFDRALFNKHGILTSKGIQSRYFQACIRRKEVFVVQEYLLVNLQKYSNIVYTTINSQNDDISINNDYKNEQSKVNKNIENENIEKKIQSTYYCKSIQEFLNILKQVQNYPFDINKDVSLFKMLYVKYTELDIVEAVRKWSIYKLDKPITNVNTARERIDYSFKKYLEWKQCLRGENTNGEFEQNNNINSSEQPNRGFKV